MSSKNLAALAHVAQGLGERLTKVAFIGGKVLDVYATQAAKGTVRPSREVDCLVGLPGLGFMPEWEKELKARGFVPVNPCESPIFHWTYQQVRVRLVPTQSQALGFENRWLEEGLFHAESYALPEGQEIRVLPPTYFLAAKLEALRHRGWADLRLSEDFEDLLYLLEVRPELPGEVEAAFYEVRDYIRRSLAQVMRHPQWQEAIYAWLPLNPGKKRLQNLKTCFEALLNAEAQTNVA